MSQTTSELPTAEVILRDGRSLRLRSIRPEDKKRLERCFYRLSPRARYLRFQYAKARITEVELTYLTEVEPPERCAYVATVGTGENEEIVAVARWESLPEEKERTAEVAFVVEDRVQFRGVGTALLEQLATVARRFDFRWFIAQVLPENTAMQEVLDESGLHTTKRLERGMYYYTIDLEQSKEFIEYQAQREHVARSAGVRHLLYPRSIAVIGASRDSGKIGGTVFRNLLGEFTGVIYPVNPQVPAVGGVFAYDSVQDIPGEVDLAVVAVPAAKVLEVVEQCAQKGIWGLIVISAGFGETDERGKEREKALRETIFGYGMRLIGPNCLGLLNTDQSVNMNASFAPHWPPSGQVSIGSQSGALGLALLDHAKGIGLGIAQFVSIGNRVDISSNDLLEFWADNEHTAVILLYLESFGNPRKFGRIARRVARTKPIVALKGGRSVAGAQAATSHTGALAAADVAVDALCRRAGIVRVSTIEELFGVAQVLAYQPFPKGERVAIVTNAGGPGILAADACAQWGLRVEKLSQAIQKRLRESLLPEASVGNPVDMVASATSEHFRRALSFVLSDPDVDAVILIYIPPLVTRPEEIAKAVREAVGSDQDKPVVACFMMSRGAPNELTLGPEQRIPSFIFPEDAVAASARAWGYSQYRNEPEGRVPKLVEEGLADQVRHYLAIEATGQATWLSQEDAIELLRMYGIPVAETRVATSADQAAQVAQRLGFPVALKVRSSRLVHKSEVGGVALHLSSEEEVRDAYHKIVRDLEAADEVDKMEGVVLQRMFTGGQEMIAGMTQDPEFGPLIMTGLGGIAVEVMKDVAFSLNPLTDADPEKMLHQLQSLPLLTGWRGHPPRDLEALKEVLLRLSALVEDLPEVLSIEINPLLLFDEGQGCIALDARVQVGKESG